MNYGLISKPIEPENFVQGDNKLGTGPILTDGDWSSWLPVAEDQNQGGFEPYACVSFAILNVVETLIRQEFGSTRNYSKRFLAFISGTNITMGNDPQTVAEALRNKGDVPETDWPYDATINSFQKFYTVPPAPLYTEALEFPAEFSYGHSWVVDTSQESLMSALNFSPLTAGVYAWQLDPSTGYYISPPGSVQEHEVMIYGYEKNNYWKIWDSYAQETKKLAWDFKFTGVKRHTIHRQVSNPTAWSKFLANMSEVIDDLKSKLQLGEYSFEKTLGNARSPKWQAFKRDFEKDHPKVCAVCGGTSKVQLHHVAPFAHFPEKELDPQNVLWLCEDPKWNCHLKWGHWDNFRTKYNPSVRDEATLWNKRFNAKSEKEAQA